MIGLTDITGVANTSLLFEVTVKVSLVLLIALAVIWCLRHRSAAARHWVLSVAIGCALVVPVLSAVAPTWQVPLTAALSLTPAAAVPAEGVETGPVSPRWAATINATRASPPNAVETQSGGMRRMAGLLVPVWLIGVGIIASVLLLGLARLAWLSSHATPVSDPRWIELASATASHLGLTRPVRLLQSDHPTLLATWGFVWPRVMLPAGAQAWEHDRRRVVLAHELAHVRRGDWATQLCADLLRALFWFNPLMWIATRCLRRDSELACDDAVLGLGVDGPDYATQLLDLAKALRSPHAMLSPGVAMARPSGLERRISAMMNPTLSRQPFMRVSRLAIVVTALAITVPLAVLAQSGTGTVSGTVVDSAGQAWGGARVVLSPVGQEVRLLKAEAMERRTLTLHDRTSALEGDEVHRIRVDLERADRHEALDAKEREVRERINVFEWDARTGAGNGHVTLDFVARERNRWSTTTDDNGRFQIEDVPPGDYELEVRLPGFSTVEETVTVAAGQHIQRQIALQIGSLEETYTVAAGAPAPVPTSVDPATLQERQQRIGDGPLQPPIKLRGLDPAYPDSLRASGTQGSVILEAVVAADGSMQVLNVLTPVDPDLLTPVQPELARAAVAAVRQWFYQPTRLHGVPVDTRMTVTINFTTKS